MLMIYEEIKEAEERYPDNSYMGREAERRGKEIARMSNQITSGEHRLHLKKGSFTSL